MLEYEFYEAEEINEPFNKSTFMQECKDIFIFWYASKDLKYIWKPKDNKGLGGIIKCIKILLKEKFNGKVPPEEIKKTIAYILKNLPEWYVKNNCEVQTINGNFNSIVNQIKNGRTKQATENRIESILNKYYPDEK